MQELLFLCHRLPYPPNKGDKIRSYHLLCYLAEKYHVHLGTFVDDPMDWVHVPAVKALCVETCIRPLRPGLARIRSLAAFGQLMPFTAAYYRDKRMQRWVDGIISNGKAKIALAFSSGMAPFLMQADRVRRIMDFVDVDSDKWRQYAGSHKGLARMVYHREANYLADYERQIATKFDACIFVSGSEARFFGNQVPALASKIHGIPNGVDTEYWDPARDYPNPYGKGERTIVFVGAMDYWSNIEGAQWFAQDVWARIHRMIPDARFYIVGSKPSRAVRNLASIDGIVVTGSVKDVRPYVVHAHAVVAPLRIARGIQNKVLEALAMAKVLLATPQAYEGIENFTERQGCISDSTEVLANEALRWLAEPTPAKVPAVRKQLLSTYNWQQTFARYDAVLGNSAVSDSELKRSAVSPVREAFP